ncbi:hypothetical protein KR026_008000 [Drosophila bipectinata]|nr:hypothetical protein KR026_008000 [Drosophila bipectinata]
MNINKAPGDDGINAIALKMLPPPSIQQITRMYNRCLDIGYFPSTWKRAQVTMIPMPGKPEGNLSSYRPIILLPMLSKILVRVESTCQLKSGKYEVGIDKLPESSGNALKRLTCMRNNVSQESDLYEKIWILI